jgi:hypothetical protein
MFWLQSKSGPFLQCSGSVTFWYLRIQICGSVPLTNGSGSDSGSCSFHQWPSRRQLKMIFLLISFWRYIDIFLLWLNLIKYSQNGKNQGFSHYFCLMIEGSGSGYESRSELLTNGSGSGRPKAYVYLTNPDPEHCLFVYCTCVFAAETLRLQLLI